MYVRSQYSILPATGGGGYPIVYGAHFRGSTTLQQHAEFKGIDKLRS